MAFGLAAARTAVAALDSEFGQQFFRRAEAGETALQQIEADEGGEGQEPFRNKDGAALPAEGEREQDEEAGHDADDAFDGH